MRVTGQHGKELTEDVMKYRSFDKLLKVERVDTYLALEELDFVWDLQEVHEFDELWTTGREEGKSPEYLINDIAEYFVRDSDEIAILALDRGRKGEDLMEWLTTGQMIDRIKMGEKAECKDEAYKVERTRRGIVFNDNQPIVINSLALHIQWRILPNYVSFGEAMKALADGKKVYYQAKWNDRIYPITTLEAEQQMISSLSVRGESLFQLTEGNWTIEEG